MAPNPKSRKQREKLLPRLAGGPEHDEPQSARPIWDKEFTYPAWVGEEFEAQVYERFRRDALTGKLLDFAVGLSVRPTEVDEGWVQVVRVDVAHGFVHVDRYDRDGRQSKHTDCVPEECMRDLDAAFKWALDYVWDIEERMLGWG